MEQIDTLKVFLELKNPISNHADYNSFYIILISGVFSLLVAFITSRLTRKIELDKIKAEQKNLSDKIQFEIRQMIISIESENLKKIYEKKLEALKAIKNIQFTVFENNFDEFDSIIEYVNSFQFETIIDNFYDLIIEYSHIFNEEIVQHIKSIYHDTLYTKNNYDPEDGAWIDFPDRIDKKYKELVNLVMLDLKLNFESVEKKIKE